MTVNIFTAPYDYPGPNKLDVSAGECPFSPSRQLEEDDNLQVDAYHESYKVEMRSSFKSSRPYWNMVLGAENIVLVCSCGLPFEECHRRSLVEILTSPRLMSLKGEYRGRIEEWDSTEQAKQEQERPVWAGKDAGVGTAILVTGDRRWTDEELVRQRLSQYPKSSVVFHGDCEGTDRISHRVAAELGMQVMPMPPSVKVNDNTKFTTRNTAMVAVLASLRWCNWKTYVEAFVMPTSKGTWDCVNKAKKKGFDPHVTRIE